ncbi:MAG TPA: TOBE domain-containing protein, partial [Anaerolineae bacterium]
RFLGLSNLIRGTVATKASGVAAVLTPLGLLNIATNRTLSVNQAVTVLIRPDAAELKDEGGAWRPTAAERRIWAGLKDEDEKFGQIEGVLIDAAFRGKYNRIVVRVNAIDLVFELDAHAVRIPIGERVRVALHGDSIMIL